MNFVMIILHGYGQLHSLHKNRRIYSDNAKDVETRFDTSSYELYRPFYKGKKEKNWFNERLIT